MLWSVLLLMGLANLGVEIGPAIAGLGVGGFAVQMDVQQAIDLAIFRRARPGPGAWNPDGESAVADGT